MYYNNVNQNNINQSHTGGITVEAEVSKDQLKFRDSHTNEKAGQETISSVAAGTSSSISQKRDSSTPAALSPSSQFMIEDIQLFRDFVLYYNKNRFKKFRNLNKTHDDQIFLNQDSICEKNQALDLYY